MTPDKDDRNWLDTLPFPKHWLGYIALKFIVIGFAIYIALRWKGLV